MPHLTHTLGREKSNMWNIQLLRLRSRPHRGSVTAFSTPKPPDTCPLKVSGPSTVIVVSSERCHLCRSLTLYHAVATVWQRTQLWSNADVTRLLKRRTDCGYGRRFLIKLGLYDNDVLNTYNVTQTWTDIDKKSMHCDNARCPVITAVVITLTWTTYFAIFVEHAAKFGWT